MAKNDAKRAQTAIDQYGNNQYTPQQRQQELLSSQAGTDRAAFETSMQGANADYSRMMGQYQNLMGDSFRPQYEGYQNFAGGGRDMSLDPKYSGQLDNAISGYQNFANTGGFSDQDIQDLRARAISPTRSVYASAQTDIDRQRSLQGGYSPNYTAASAKLARDLADSISGANVNANASIAQMVQQGKLAGLGGLSDVSLQQQQMKSAIDQINNQMRLSGLSGMTEADQAQLAQRLGAMSGMGNLYGTAPGTASMLGQRAGQTQGYAQQGQNDLNNFGMAIIQAIMNKSSIPSNFQQGMGNLGSIFNAVGQVAAPFTGLGSGGGRGPGLPFGTNSRGPF